MKEICFLSYFYERQWNIGWVCVRKHDIFTRQNNKWVIFACRRENHPTRAFSRVGWFLRALALLSLRKNGGLLVVYFACEKITIAMVQYNNSHLLHTKKIIHLISEMVKYFSGIKQMEHIAWPLGDMKFLFSYWNKIIFSICICNWTLWTTRPLNSLLVRFSS